MGPQLSDPLTAATLPQRRMHEIDLLRFIAALMVVVLHLSSGGVLGHTTLDYSDSVGQLGRYGYLGVDLFFMISGMVVFMSLWGRTPIAFLISRISRLYPAFWAGVTITSLVLLYGAVNLPRVTVGQYLANLTMFAQPLGVPNVEGVYWTLWAEWRFYFLLVVFSVIGITLRRTYAFLWGWLAATLLVEFLPLPYRIGHALELAIQPVYSHYFIAGMALYLVRRHGFTANLAMLLVGAYGNALYQGVRHADERSRLYLLHLNPLIITMTISTIFLVMTLVATGKLARLNSRRLKPVGDLTYPLYLVHGTVGYAVLNVFADAVNRWLLLGSLMTALCLLAWAMNRLVEVPLQPRLRDSLTSALTPLVTRRSAVTDRLPKSTAAGTAPQERPTATGGRR
ncbi:acyltransferase [Micromonospora sp. PLK6-60]|uniref:acyltransferase family protein n=1 Tax=Micromonospora sp. PLK6-60 TaxID=2873383 RepID=UPI001CA6095F|nr:acyltransferase [Micromonospora sp. PLK6-60]MBY8873143.1 acyltransferase [Micromonospora sp. PLK6-60]